MQEELLKNLKEARDQADKMPYNAQTCAIIRSLNKAILLCLVLSSCAVPNKPSTMNPDQIIEAHNAYRQSKGLSPLIKNDLLNQIALNHSNDMAAHHLMSHLGSDFSTPFIRMNRVGYNFSYAGENIAAGYNYLDDVMNAWKKSPGHNSNILNENFTDIGVAVVDNYWTVDFGSLGKASLPLETITETTESTSSIRMK